ncbi:hypothetical protein IAG25_25400 [Caballeronia sp. EK]|uniref:hypothetical protein n=1 Tax=Caballeronia sp. EK TaxID=2767469 RepID=UPI001656222B|nr:hypothetical protein [Caballeronia sp. EK]MBC8640171.1 hypothetical protein [Caballeronia sp. EK]
MARERFEFVRCGVHYRTQEFSATEGLAITSHDAKKGGPVQPHHWLRLTEVQTPEGEWVSLSQPRNIDAYVKAIPAAVAPHIALAEVIDAVRGYNFDFLDTWKPVPVPTRFVTDLTPRKHEGVHPILSRLEGEHLASRRDLQEFYSLRDAFGMFDASCLRAVNAALAAEKAELEAKRKAKGG